MHSGGLGAFSGAAQAESICARWGRQPAAQSGCPRRRRLSQAGQFAYHCFRQRSLRDPGGMPTATARGVDLVQVAKGSGIQKSSLARTTEEFKQRMEMANDKEML